MKDEITSDLNQDDLTIDALTAIEFVQSSVTLLLMPTLPGLDVMLLESGDNGKYRGFTVVFRGPAHFAAAKVYAIEGKQHIFVQQMAEGGMLVDPVYACQSVATIFNAIDKCLAISEGPKQPGIALVEGGLIIP